MDKIILKAGWEGVGHKASKTLPGNSLASNSISFFIPKFYPQTPPSQDLQKEVMSGVSTHPKCYVQRQEPLPGGPKTGPRFPTLMNSSRLVRRTSVLSQNPLLQLWAILTKGAAGKSPEALDCQRRLEFSPLVPQVLPSSLRSTATRIAQGHSGPMEMTTCPQI